jgi:hypothetical protein
MLFAAQQDGTMTIMGLFFVLISLMVGGLAVDFSKVIAYRSQLQVAADATAHAALISRDTMSEDEAKELALEIGEMNLPSEVHGNAIQASDIEFGYWDADSQTFTPTSGSTSAVRVRAQKLAERSNAVSTHLLHIVGVDEFDVLAPSIYSTYSPTCLQEGFAAENSVVLRSNNSFYDGFCIHSNGTVSLRNNNYFEEGTIVSMPDLANLDIPGSGMEQNTGLAEALTTGQYELKVVDQVDVMLADLADVGPLHTPDYVYGSLAYQVTLTASSSSNGKGKGKGNSGSSDKKISVSDLVQNRTNALTCDDGDEITIEDGTYEEVVFITNCDLKFDQGVVLQDAIFATTSTSDTSMTSPSGFQLGSDDACSPGGGAILVTAGGVKFAAKLQVYGGQIIAKTDIDFTANANGVEGASFLAGNEISGTSNTEMRFCGDTGMEHVVHDSYFRMSY